MRVAGVADIVPGTVPCTLPDSPFFEHARSADIAVGNLEVPLTSRLNPQHGGIVLHAPVEFAFELPRAGITVASVANNHVLGHGQPGLDDTLEACARAGVTTVGFGANRHEAVSARYVDVQHPGGQARVAIVSATSVGPRDTFATDQPGLSGIRVTTSLRPDPRAAANPGIAGTVVTEPDEDDLVALEQAIQRAREQTPIVIAVLHWGLGETVLDYMKTTAMRVIDAGASVVFGHHTHRLAAVDWYGDAPVFYGLGSYIFQYDGDIPVHIPRDAAVALLDINTTTGKAESAELIIGRLDPGGVPWPATPDRVERVVEDVIRLSAANPVTFEITASGCRIMPR